MHREKKGAFNANLRYQYKIRKIEELNIYTRLDGDENEKIKKKNTN